MIIRCIINDIIENIIEMERNNKWMNWKGFVDSMSNKNEFGNDIISLKVIIINGKDKDVKWMVVGIYLRC